MDVPTLQVATSTARHLVVSTVTPHSMILLIVIKKLMLMPDDNANI